jgi:hypothetical protein
MATISKIAMVVAGAHLVALASPSTAFAQTAPATTEAPVTAPMPAPSAAASSMVWVHLQGSQVAELQQDTVGDRKHWQTVCAAPCDKEVSPAFAYRIAGDGIRNSRVFSLHGQDGDRETIDVDEGSTSGFVLGIVSVSVGAFAMAVGLFVVLINSLSDTLDGGNTSNSGEETGWVISGIGLAGVIGGAFAIATNARTRVAPGVAPGAAPPSPAAWLLPGGGPIEAPGFTGGWKDAILDARRGAGPGRALPPVVGVGIPLFGGTF